MHSASVRISAVTIKEEDAFCGDTKSVFDVKKCFEKTCSPETPGDSIESDHNDKTRLTEEFHHMAIEEYVDVDGTSPKVDVEEEDKEEWLPSATAEAMETYENTLHNIYLGQATGKSITGEESMPCDCRYNPNTDDPNAACGDDNFCINRMMFMECTENDCSCERFCRNRRFQLRQYARVDVIKTEKKGYGLRALTDLPVNAFVMEYIGEVITNSEFVRRTKMYEAEGLSHYYFMTLKTDEIIDATKKGCLARFINHSCSPNCVTQKWVVGKVMRIGIFTRTPIKAGQELTFDYKFERYGAVAQKCYCGEANCKGFIGGVSDDVPEEEAAETPILPTDDEEDFNNGVIEPKKLKRKPGRPRNPRPIKNEDEVNDLVKNMLDSVGKMHLVNKLLHSLELTTPDTTTGRDVLKKFVRLHGLRLLKLWLGEWKNNDDIIEKVLHVLQQLPLANRNGLDDCGMFDVVQRFSEHANHEISNVALDLLDEWAHLNRVYRIPKRAAAEQPLAEEDDTDGQSGVKRANEDESEDPPTKRVRFQSTREFFDPDDDYYEYLSMEANAVEIYWRMQYPPVPIIPTGPRAQQQQLHAPPTYPYYYGPRKSPEKRPYYNKHTTTEITAAYTDPKKSVAQQPDPASYSVATTTTTTYDTTMTFDASRLPTGPASEEVAMPKLPPNWRWAMDTNGSVYYYNRLTGKTQWEVPEDKASSIEGVSQAEIDGLVEKAILDAQKKKGTPIESTTPTSDRRPLSSSSNGESSSSKRKVLKDAELKQEVSKVVTRHLSAKKSLWKNDKTVFKELARKLTHHIVDRENNSSRRIHKMNDSLRAKIERFIDDHGADFANKLERKQPVGKKDARSTPASSPDYHDNSPYRQSPYHTSPSNDSRYSSTSPVYYIRKHPEGHRASPTDSSRHSTPDAPKKKFG